MRVKPIPSPPQSLDTVSEAQTAVPLVPGGEDDCCTRLQTRLSLPSRDEARRWLTMLRGLGLVAEGPQGYYRTRTDLSAAGIREAFLDGVYGARELRAMLADSSGLTGDEAVERFDEHVPHWERHRSGGGTAWADRVERLLDWLVLLGLAERVDGQYLATATDRD